MYGSTDNHSASHKNSEKGNKIEMKSA